MGVMNEDRLTLYDGLIKTHITNTTVAKETGKGLSTNDYTTTEKNKLAGIAEGANKTIVDSALDVSSENPVQNKVVKEQIDALTTQINNAIALRSSLEQYGMAKLSNSAAVTDSTGLALPATEKNATIEGTLANQIAQLNTNLNIEPINIVKASSKAVYKTSEFFRIGHIGWYNMWLEYDAIQGADIFEEIIFEFPEDIFVRYITGGACSAYGGAIHGSIDSLIYSNEHSLSVRVAGAINTQNFIIYATGMFLIY